MTSTSTVPHAPSHDNLAVHSLVLTTTEKRLLYLLVGIQFFNIVDFMVMMPLAPMLTYRLGINTAQFGVLVSVYTFAGAVAGLIFALFSDRFERKRLLLVIYSLFIVATLACALSPTYEWLLLARGSAGIFGGVLGAMVNTLVADNIAPQRRGQAMGKVMMAFSLASVIGVPVALWLAHHSGEWDWRTPFAAVAGLALLLWGVVYREVPTGITPKPAQAGELVAALKRMKSVLIDTNHQIALLFMVVMMGSSFTVIPYLTMYATKNVGFPESMLWLMYLLGGATTLLTSPRIGKWADVAGKLKVFRIMALCSAVPILLITHAMPMPMWLYLCLSTAFFLTVNGRVVPAQALVAGAVHASMRGTFMGLQSCAMSFGLGLASLIGGHLIGSAADGRIVHFEQAGYVAVCAIAIIVWLSGKVQQRA